MADIKYLTIEHLPTKSLIRVFSKISIDISIQWNNTPCWNWAASTDTAGYGLIRWQSRLERPHRLIFAWLVHPLPRGDRYKEIDHLCRNHACCNPVHLEFVDHRTNVMRGNSLQAINATKTHCIYGHPLNGDNLRLFRGNPRRRQCVQCHKDRVRTKAYREKEKILKTRRKELFPEELKAVRRKANQRYYTKQKLLERP